MTDAPDKMQCAAKAARAAKYGNIQLAYKWIERAKMAQGPCKRCGAPAEGDKDICGACYTEFFAD